MRNNSKVEKDQLMWHTPCSQTWRGIDMLLCDIFSVINFLVLYDCGAIKVFLHLVHNGLSFIINSRN